MKDYYQILGIPSSASHNEIRRAYRRLVHQLHPDVNPDPDAHERISEINEAYEVLSDPQKRVEYDYRLNNPFTTIVAEEAPKHRDPAYKRRTYTPRAKQGPTQRDLMVALMKYLRIVNWAGCAIVVLLIGDFSLPRSVVVEKVTGFRSEPVRRGWQEYMITDSGREVKISAEDMNRVATGAELEFIESAILGILLRVRSADHSLIISNLATLYGNFIFVPVLLFLFSALGIAGLGGIEFRFNLAIVNVFILIFTLIIMFK